MLTSLLLWRGDVPSLMNTVLSKLRASEAEQARAAEHDRMVRIVSGPPDARVSRQQWEHWVNHGWITCPGRSGRSTCDAEECCVGIRCRLMAAKGLSGDGQALPRKKRPRCGAKTRAGGECLVRVEPGKARCRFHGGRSTGARTEEGRVRIGEGQKRRWAAWRSAAS